MLSFYLQQVSGHHTQRESLRQSSSTLHLKHILAGQIAVLVPSTRRWVLCSSSFLYLLAQTHLFKPSLVGSPFHLRRAMPKPVWAWSEVPSSFVVPSIFSYSNSTRFDCIPPHPFFVLSENPFLKPTSMNPFRKPISQTHDSKPNSDEIYIFIYIYIYIYLWSFIFWYVVIWTSPTIVMKPDNNDGLEPQDRVDKICWTLTRHLTGWKPRLR